MASREAKVTVRMKDWPEVKAVIAERDRLRAWFDELEQAAGMGALADVAGHQRSRGLEGDHETRLRAKRVANLKATVMEEHEWRRQVLHEWQERAEQAEEERDSLRAAVDAALALADDFDAEAQRFSDKFAGYPEQSAYQGGRTDSYEDAAERIRVALAPVADPAPHTTSDEETTT